MGIYLAFCYVQASVEQSSFVYNILWQNVESRPVMVAAAVPVALCLAVLTHHGRYLRMAGCIALLIPVVLMILVLTMYRSGKAPDLVTVVTIAIAIAAPPLALYAAVLLITSRTVHGAMAATLGTFWGLLPRRLTSGVSKGVRRLTAWRRQVIDARQERRRRVLRDKLGLPPLKDGESGPQIIVVNGAHRGGVVAWFQAMFWMAKIGVVAVGVLWAYVYANNVIGMTKQWATETAQGIVHEAVKGATAELPPWMRNFMR